MVIKKISVQYKYEKSANISSITRNDNSLERKYHKWKENISRTAA